MAYEAPWRKDHGHAAYDLYVNEIDHIGELVWCSAIHQYTLEPDDESAWTAWQIADVLKFIYWLRKTRKQREIKK